MTAAVVAPWQPLDRGEGSPAPAPADAGATPLHEAAARADVESLEALLAARADANAVSEPGGDTPLHLLLKAEAVREAVLRAASALMSAGADPSIVNRDGLRPQDLTDEGDLRQAIGATPFLLHDALRSCNLLGVAEMLERITSGELPRCFLDARNNWPGYAPIHVACGAPATQGTALLVEARASVELRTKDGQAPLHLAAWSGSFFVADILLEARADVHACEPDQDRNDGSKVLGQDPQQHFTALHIASKCGNVALIQRLLAAGAEVDAKDSYERTPLHLCIEGYFDDDLGPGVGVRVTGLKSRPERNGKLAAIVGPLEIDGGCAGCEDPECGRYPVLVEEGPPEGVLLKPLNVSGVFADAVDLLLAARADANLSCSRSAAGVVGSPLHVAARQGDCGLAQKLIEAGANVNLQQAGSGHAPLHIAARCRRVDMATLLLRARADGDLLAGGKTPAQLATKNKMELDFDALVARPFQAVQLPPPRRSEFDGASEFERAALHLE